MKNKKASKKCKASKDNSGNTEEQYGKSQHLLFYFQGYPSFLLGCILRQKIALQ